MVGTETVVITDGRDSLYITDEDGELLYVLQTYDIPSLWRYCGHDGVGEVFALCNGETDPRKCVAAS